MQKEQKRKMELYLQYSKPFIDELARTITHGVKGYLISKTGQVETVYHDWFLEHKRQVEEHLQQKAAQLNLQN